MARRGAGRRARRVRRWIRVRVGENIVGGGVPRLGGRRVALVE